MGSITYTRCLTCRQLCEKNKKSSSKNGTYCSGYCRDLRSRTYTSWYSMKSRCYNDAINGYENYGGRGIKVCDRWINSFDNFVKDMGYRKSITYQIDRIDTEGNYSPDNCRWTTRRLQANNRRSTVKVSYNGVEKSITLWAEELGIKPGTLLGRIKRGWSVEKAFNQRPEFHHLYKATNE